MPVEDRVKLFTAMYSNEYDIKINMNDPFEWVYENQKPEKRTVYLFKSKNAFKKNNKKFYKRLDFCVTEFKSHNECEKTAQTFIKKVLWMDTNVDKFYQRFLKGQQCSVKSMPFIVVVNNAEMIHLDTLCEYQSSNGEKLKWKNDEENLLNVFLDKNTNNSYFLECGCGGPFQMKKDIKQLLAESNLKEF